MIYAGCFDKRNAEAKNSSQALCILFGRIKIIRHNNGFYLPFVAGSIIGEVPARAGWPAVTVQTDLNRYLPGTKANAGSGFS